MSSSEGPVPEVDPEGALSMLSEGGYLLDVREGDEWEAGRAPMAHHIALGELEHRYREIPVERLVVCVCRGGGRSARAAEALAGAGYRTVNLAGGMRAWAAAGLDVVIDGGALGEVI